MKRFALAVAALAASAGFAAAQDAPPKVQAQCQSCHGPHGDSSDAHTPRLNGQTANYLQSRLKSFRDPTRQSIAAIHAMWDISSHVGDEDIPAIAQYYARQTPTAPSGKNSARAKQGARLYALGAKGIPACASCHGAHGEGTAIAPRLAGQHGLYLDYQITAFTVTMRAQGTMNHTALDITQPQIDALVAYLAKD